MMDPDTTDCIGGFKKKWCSLVGRREMQLSNLRMIFARVMSWWIAYWLSLINALVFYFTNRVFKMPDI